MADEYRFLDPAQTTLTSLNGTAEDTHEDPYTTQSAWLTATDPGNDTELDGTFNPPSENLDGTQEFQVRVRATNNATSGDPDVTITLDDGSQPVSSAAVPLGTEVVYDSADGLTLAPADVADASAVTITVAGSSNGGMPGTRDTVEMGAVRWAVGLAQFLDIFTHEPSGVSTGQATFEGEVDFAAYDSVDVWFEWGEVGAGFPNSTARQTESQPTTFSELVDTLSPDTEYEVRAHAETGDGSDSGTGTTYSFWTTFIISGVVDVDGTTTDGVVVYITAPESETTTRVTTGTDGGYSAEVDGGTDYHVAAQHDDGTDQYAGESYPWIRGGN